MKKLFLIIGVGCISNSFFAQTKDSTASPFSLQQAIDYALKNQYNVQNSIVDQELAAQKVKEVTGLGLPQLNGSADFKDFLSIPTSLIPAAAFGGPPGVYTAAKFGTQYQATVGVDASQLLFSGDYIVGLQASKTYAELSLKNTQRTKVETAVAVSKAYYTVLINEQRIKSLDANIERVKTAMGGAEGMYAYGFAEKLDLDRLTVTYNNLLIEKEKTQRLVLLSRYLLRYQMGIDVNTNVQLTDKLEDVKFDVAANANAEKFDYNKRVEYGLYETQKKLNELDLKKTKFAFLPTAVLYGNISGYGYSKGYNSNQDYFINHRLYPSTFIGAKVTMPIFTGFQRNSRTQQAKLNLQKAQNNIESLKKSIDLELASSMTMLQNAAVSLDNQKKNITLAEEVYRITKYKYEQGVGTNLEMVTAETSLKEAQTNYYNALYDAIVAKIDYDKANGNLKY
jgi:outer membrane protein TolC